MQEVIIAVTRILSNQHIDPYNMKLILSCLKQTLTQTQTLILTLGPVTPTTGRKSSITKSSFEGKMKDGCLSKLTITKSGHQATQHKKVVDTLHVFCADKNYRYINNIICTNTKLQEVAFLYPYPDTGQMAIYISCECPNCQPECRRKQWGSSYTHGSVPEVSRFQPKSEEKTTIGL